MVWRIGSYNIRLGLEQGLGAVAETLVALDADLLALQEIGRNWTMGECVDQVELLARRAGYDWWEYCPTLQRGSGLFGHAVLSRAPMCEVRRWDLPRQRDEPRRFVSGKVCGVHGRDVPFVSLHLSHLDDERPPQAEAVFEWIASHVATGPLLLLGDLNEPDPSRLSASLSSVGLTDCGAAEGTWTFPTREPRDRRDVVLQRGFAVEEALVVGTSRASDHLPIVVGLAPSWSE